MHPPGTPSLHLLTACLSGLKSRSSKLGQSSSWSRPAGVALKQDQESKMMGQYFWSVEMEVSIACILLVQSISLYIRYSEEMKWGELGSTTEANRVSKEDSKGSESLIVISEDSKLLLTIIRGFIISSAINHEIRFRSIKFFLWK